MMADHKEYEPSFVDGDLYIGEFKVRDQDYKIHNSIFKQLK